jgi:hypothetical protein
MYPCYPYYTNRAQLAPNENLGEKKVYSSIHRTMNSLAFCYCCSYVYIENILHGNYGSKGKFAINLGGNDSNEHAYALGIVATAC